MQVREAVNVKFFNNNQRIFTTAKIVESGEVLVVSGVSGVQVG